MGPMMMAALIVTASAVTNITFDIGLNAFQNWSGTAYTDALWAPRTRPSPALERLAKEEAEIDRLLTTPDFQAVEMTPSDDGRAGD